MSFENNEQNKKAFTNQPACNDCVHFLPPYSCAAFDVIPDEIWFDSNPHTEPLPGQKNSVTFQQKE